MSMETRSKPVIALTTFGAWFLALIWILPLLYAFWAAFHAPGTGARFDLFAPWTLENFSRVLSVAPFGTATRPVESAARARPSLPARER